MSVDLLWICAQRYVWPPNKKVNVRRASVCIDVHWLLALVIEFPLIAPTCPTRPLVIGDEHATEGRIHIVVDHAAEVLTLHILMMIKLSAGKY